MPYIKQFERAEIKAAATALSRAALSPGQLNYAISTLVHCWLGKACRYNDYNEAIGVLECVKLELYRDVIGPYEQKKKDENGAIP